MPSSEKTPQDTNDRAGKQAPGMARAAEQARKAFSLMFDDESESYAEAKAFGYFKDKEVYRSKEKDRFLQFAYDMNGRKLTERDGTLDAPRPGVRKLFRRGQSLGARAEALIFGFDTFLMIESIISQAKCVQSRMKLRVLQQRCEEELAPLASLAPSAPDVDGENQEAADGLSHLLTTRYGLASQITPKTCLIHDGEECAQCEDLQKSSFSFAPLPSVLGDVDDEADDEKQGGSEDDETQDGRIGGTEDGKIGETGDDKGDDGMGDDEGDGEKDDKKQATDKGKGKNKRNERKSGGKRNRHRKK